jgi:hypothetical protein
MNKEKLAILKYDQLWLDYKVLTMDLLQTQVNEFNNGKDKNTEHYRFATFKNYLQAQTSISDEQISNLFDIIKTDSDISMASSMAIDILKTKTLTESQFNMVADLLKHSFGDNMQKYIDREIVWRKKQRQEK